MMLQVTVLLSLLAVALAQVSPNAVPVSGDNGAVGGIFGFGMPDMSKLSPSASAAPPTGAAKGEPKAGGLGALMQAMGDKLANTSVESLGSIFGGQGKEAVTGGVISDEEWWHPGTGPYPAQYFTDASLPSKTIYAPKVPPPANVKMPVIAWGEGGCFQTGTFYAPFLLELASHGYVILANGVPGTRPPKTIGDLMKLQSSNQTKVSDLLNSISWALAGKGAKYGNLDTTKIATAGQSCGGTEALSAAYHNDNVKLTFLVNSGTLNPASRPFLNEFKYPIGYFNGGPKDIAYKNVISSLFLLDDYLLAHTCKQGEADYATITKVPVFDANLDTGVSSNLSQ
jgi:hypothetical protein